LSTSASLSFCQTTSREAGSWTSPVIVIAIAAVSFSSLQVPEQALKASRPS
jgi:hypothetical protein